MRCVTQHNARLTTETEALKLSNLASKIVNIVLRKPIFVVVENSTMNFSVALGEKYGMSILAAWKVDITKGMV